MPGRVSDRAGYRAIGALALALGAAIGLGTAACSSDPQAIAGVTGRMDFSRKTSFWTAPLPSEDLRSGGVISLQGYPNPDKVDLVKRTLLLLERDAAGFGTSSGVFLPFTGALPQPLLPTVEQSTGAEAKVFLLSIDPDAPDAFTRHPVRVAFASDGGPFGADNLLSLLPVQGLPLEPGHAYAAVVRRSLESESGRRLGVSLNLAKLLAGERPGGLPEDAFAVYQRAVAALRRVGVPLADVSGLAAFTTQDPTRQLSLVRDDGLSRAAPLPGRPLALLETWPAYCVFSSTVQLPVWQAGTPPYASLGGGWAFDVLGAPVFQRFEEANLFVTVPRAKMPAAGWPAVLYVRAGGSGDKPVVDRGPRPAKGQPYTAGEGPAMNFAEVGFAAVEVDGPLGGLRNGTHGDEQFLVFNFVNPEALRDNIRQSAIELSLVARALDRLAIAPAAAAACAGTSAGAQKFDLGHLAIWGHSTGATIAPLAAAIEPRIGAVLLSGSGGSYLENVLWKKAPLDVKPLAELLLGYTAKGRSLTADDPVLSLIQWAAEPADPQVYARRLARAPPAGTAPRHLLQFQGIVDHYILPPLVQAVSIPLGVDLAGPALDVASAELSVFTPLEAALGRADRGRIALPARGNQAAGAVTAVVVQQPQDGIEDGHEVAFQTEAPKHQYRCFLKSWLAGVPQVPVAGGLRDPCP